jgi:hypothetical protein
VNVFFSSPSLRYFVRAASSSTLLLGSSSGPVERGAYAGLPTMAPLKTRLRQSASV